MKRCPNCHVENPKDNSFCLECGYNLNKTEIVCSRCQTSQAKTFKYCISCGNELSLSSQETISLKPSVEEKHSPSKPIEKRASLTLLDENGETQKTLDLHEENDVIEIGRKAPFFKLSDDPFTSDYHARISSENNNYYLYDLQSLNGIYIKIKAPYHLKNDDKILLGLQVLIFRYLNPEEMWTKPVVINGISIFGSEKLSSFATLVQYSSEGWKRNMHYLHAKTTTIGRNQGEITFPTDHYMSNQHASIVFEIEKGKAFLQDENSINGSFVKLSKKHNLQDKDEFRIGKQLFRFNINSSKQGNA